MSAKRAENTAFQTAAKGGLERTELQGVTPGSVAEQVMQQSLAGVELITPEPALVADSFKFLDSPELMPANFVHSPRQVRQKAQASQMNIRVSNEGRFHMDSYLMDLKRAGRPVYMFEVIDAMLRNLKDPEFRAQVTAMLDGETL